jgi:molybdopterin-guanine dinucleotide biosynthesis protein A
VACDMPFLHSRLLEALLKLAPGWDAVAPWVSEDPETLCTVYHRRCLAEAEAMLQAGDLKLGHLLERVRTRTVPAAELRRWDPELTSFVNINTPQDLAQARARWRHQVQQR